MDYYQLLDVPRDADFQTLKKAYYRQAKKCHPDHFNNSPEKNEEFKSLVAAFNTLSDPDARAAYDASLRKNISTGSAPGPLRRHKTVMDTEADDILEELVVGNDLNPAETTIWTLFLDMRRTEIFIAWRSAEYLYKKMQYGAAAKAFRKLVRRVPGNILYRVYCARSCAKCGNAAEALFHYHRAFKLGEHRSPPQKLHHIRREVHDMLRNSSSFLLKAFTLFFPEEKRMFVNEADDMIEEMNHAIAKLERERNKKELEERSYPQLTSGEEDM